MALVGRKFRANPTGWQRLILCRWMGCARFVWNAKCEENDYFYNFKQKFLALMPKRPSIKAMPNLKTKRFRLGCQTAQARYCAILCAHGAKPWVIF